MPAHPLAVRRTALRSRTGLLVLGLLTGAWALAAPHEAAGQAPESGPEPGVGAESGVGLDPGVHDSRAQDLRAQDLRAQDLRTQDLRTQDSEPAVQASLLVGSRGLGSRAHPFVGLEGSVHRDRFGVAATGQLGSGNDYRSTLLGLGPSVRLVTAASTRLSVWAGVSRYREELDGDLLPPGSGTADRSVTGGLLGVTLRRPLPWGSISLHATWLAGRLDDEDLVVPHRVQGLRLAVGLGR
jgi:hypothetical protein